MARSRAGIAFTRFLLGVVDMLLLCHHASAANGSVGLTQYAHTAWTARERFMGATEAIVQTSDGYLWLGTEFGLVRFDGMQFSPWAPPAGERLPSGSIMSLLAARDGALWIGTIDGLASFQNSKLIRYPKIAGEPVFALLQDHQGAVWVGLRGRVCAIRNANIECSDDHHLLGGVGVFSLFEDGERHLWAGEVASGLWEWKPGPPRRVLPGPVNTYQAIAQGDNGTGLIAVSGGILRQVRAGNTGKYAIPGVQEPFARHLLRDRSGGLWIGTWQQGLLHVYDGKTTRFTHGDGLSSDTVTALFQDREGSIWVATTNGLDRFRESAVSTISAKQGLSDQAWSVLSSRDGSVWIGTQDGLNRWHQGQMTIYRSPSEPKTPLRGELATPSQEVTDAALPDNKIGSLFEDRRGRIWVTSRKGVAWLENGKFTRVSGSLPVGAANAIFSDRHEGGVWIGYPDHGLFHVVDGKIVESASWPWSDGIDPRLSALISDPVKGGLWVGFKHEGIACLTDDRVSRSLSNNDGLGAGRVWNLQIDREGTLWAATEGGLSRIKDGRVMTLTTQNGLPCDAVHWVIEDDAFSLWLYTACGLVRITRPDLEAWALDPKRAVHATIFDGSDGVIAHALLTPYTPVVTKAPDGKLWFAHLDGVSAIDPRHLPFNKLPPPVHIEQITVDHKIRWQNLWSSASSVLRLPPLSRDLEIDYTALSLVAPEKNGFRYKLEGYDRDWIDAGHGRQAFYSDLTPRSYRFRVMASNNSGVWNHAGASFDFSIAPAYYQTTWFGVTSVATFLLMIWAIYQVRVRVLQRHQGEISALNERLMKAQEDERLRIAAELHDGVLQQITSVTLRLGTATLKLPPDSDAKARIRALQKDLIQMGTEIRHLSHELHPVLLQEAGLTAALCSYCEEFSTLRGIPTSCETDESVDKLPPGAALCIYRIAQEALGNVAKHSKAKQAEVRLSQADGNVSLSVSDDGVGFNAQQKTGGLGLINMRERVHQLNGTFEFSSEPGRGTRVRATVPFRPAL